MREEEAIQQAVERLNEGGLVAFPTETVYGLGADASNPEALRKIFTAKGRPTDHPLIVHLADATTLTQWAREVPESAWRLAQAFWPGPLTLILKKAPRVSDLVTGNQDTIGIRVPGHPVAQALLRAFGGGLAAPSANRFGHISPTTAQAVREELGDTIDMVLEGGQCAVGVESTIVDVTQDTPVILRPGMITPKQIEAVLSLPVASAQQNSPRVSGSLESHYAPNTRTVYIAHEHVDDWVAHLSDAELPCAVLSREKKVFFNTSIQTVLMPSSANQYAHDLYRVLRELDNGERRIIVVEAVPAGEEWDAIRDRLKRASTRS